MVQASIARETLSKARTLLDLTGRLDLNEREAFEALLDGAIVLGRSVTIHIQKQYASKAGFPEWYEQEQLRLRDIPLCRFFLKRRNVILKEGLAGATRKISVSIYETVTAKTSMDAVLVRGQPWYRRNPNILWEDLRAGVRLRWVRFRRVRALRHPPTVQRTKKTRSTQSWHFDDPNWNVRSALALVHDYLDILEPVVAEAERRFGGTGK